jgi:HAD superfamily hydrolase (TIGR01509 family)
VTGLAIFLDAAGVLLDSDAMPTQWRRLCGEFFAPRLGGDPGAWASANAWAAERMWARYRDPKGTPNETHMRLRRLWLREMCERVGVVAPRNSSELVLEAHGWICERVTAPLPGAALAVRALKAAGYRLFTSTGQPSWEIAGYLRAMGLRDLFEERTYGSDLVDRWKTSSAFFTRILEDAGVAPRDAVAVDDAPRCTAFARRAGMQTFLVSASGADEDVIPSLAALASRLGDSSPSR